MCDMRNYPKEFIQEFIELYRSYPCLWKIKSKEYSNRDLRNTAYSDMVEKMKEIEPSADKDLVIRKINSLRTAFRRELKKVMDSKRSGASADDVYEPRLWYYDLLLFTGDQELQRESKSSLDPDEDELLAQGEEGSNNEEPCEQSSSEVIQEGLPLKTRKLRNKGKITTQNSLLQRAHSVLSQAEDACEIFGRNVASKLRLLSKEQRLSAEKIINDTLLFGELDKLSLEFATQFSSSIQNFIAAQNYQSPSYTSYSSTSAANTPIMPQDSDLFHL